MPVETNTDPFRLEIFEGQSHRKTEISRKENEKQPWLRIHIEIKKEGGEIKASSNASNDPEHQRSAKTPESKRRY